MSDKKLGYGNCSDCAWYMSPEGCNVERDSERCNLNRKPREEEDETDSKNDT